MKFSSLFIYTSLCCFCFIANAQEKKTESVDYFRSTSNGEIILKKFFALFEKFRTLHDGAYPLGRGGIISDLMQNPKSYGYEDHEVALKQLINPDNQFSESKSLQRRADKTISVVTPGTRPDGSPIGSPLRKGEQDLLAYTTIYVRQNASGSGNTFSNNPSGYYLTLMSNGLVSSVPYDESYWQEGDGGFSVVFPNQAGLRFNVIRYEEYHQYVFRDESLIGKPETDAGLIVDNGGPEALVQLSRRVRSPNVYGNNREDIWKIFDPSKREFTLTEIQAGAAKLGLDTQVQRLSLSQLQKSGSSAILFLKDDGRIVTLTSLDDNHAVVVDRGATRNIERSVLETRYSGEALVPTKAVTQSAGIVATDAVRELQLPSLEAEVPQQFVIRNTGQTPLTLQLEYPLLGVTESKLSRDTLAPGETATLDLKVKWRSILKAPTQNVLVSLQTSDPIVPRLQLAILLVPPKAANAK